MLMMTDARAQAERAAVLATEHARLHPISAEIVPGKSPGWYVVVTMPDHENIASGHLIGRRFGVSDPFGMVEVVVRGRKKTRHQRLLPGYLLVFAWDIEEQKDRIRACPGVLDILRKPNGDAVIVSDAIIDELQGKEMSRSAAILDLANRLEIEPALPLPVARAKAERSKKWSKKNKKKKKAAPVVVLPPPPKPVEMVTIRPYSALEGIEELADGERIILFNRAIGLGSQYPPQDGGNSPAAD